MLSERQVLKTTIKEGRVGVRWDVDDWIQYISDQRDVLEEMHFPRFRDDHSYVFIVPGDGLPCGERSWCQVACGFANHMQKARSLLYNWTLDLALVSEHETDLARVLFGETLKEIQQIIDRGYMLLDGFGCGRLSLLEAIALGFVIYLAYQHFMKLVQFILLRHGLGRKKDG